MDSERDRRAEAVADAADAAEAAGTVSVSSAGYDPEPEPAVKFQEEEAVVSVVGQGLVVLA